MSIEQMSRIAKAASIKLAATETEEKKQGASSNCRCIRSQP